MNKTETCGTLNVGKVYIVVLCKCGTKCRGKRWKHTVSPFSQRGLLSNCVLDNNFLI